MKHLSWIVAASIGGWTAVVLAGGPAAESFFGMLGPLVAVVSTVLVVEWTQRQNPSRIGSVLVGAFGVKMLFFGVYVAVVTQLLNLELVAFVTSFLLFFMPLYAAQAVLVRGVTLRQVS
jgi:hypothetical protein